MAFNSNKPYLYFFLLFLVGIIISAVHPHDYFTWFLEVAPGIVAFFILLFTSKRFPLSNLALFLLLIHCYVLFIGGHYTYAEVPLFEKIKLIFNQSRNNYDKVGHFMQGFVPAIVIREVLIRNNVVQQKGWLSFIIISICLAISSLYELFEAFIAITTGEAADSFLGTQGYVWDTQSDMFICMVGSIAALILLSKLHDRSIKKITASI